MRWTRFVVGVGLVLACAWTASAQITLPQIQLPAEIQCPEGTVMLPVFTPGEGLSYECRQDKPSRDALADRLTMVNAGLVVIDSTLTGYLVWAGVAKEANPLMAPIFDGDRPWRVGVKGAIEASSALAIYRLTKPKSKARYTAIGVKILINLYAVVNNYNIYRDHQNKVKAAK